MRAPDFVIAGHPKCGSTTLQRYLEQHSQLHMGSRKEPSLYLEQWEEWRQGSLLYFPEGLPEKTLCGDATVGYVKDADVAKRIAMVNPSTKIVFLLRDPVDRALSHYHHWLRHGKDVRSLRRVIFESGPDHYFYLFGMYFEHLTTYLKYFPKEQIHCLFFEDLTTNPTKALESLWEFLEVEVMEMKRAEFWENAGHSVKGRWLSRWLKRQKESDRLRSWFPPVMRKVGGAALRKLEVWNRSDTRYLPNEKGLAYMRSVFNPEVEGVLKFIREEKGRTHFPKWTRLYDVG